MKRCPLSLTRVCTQRGEAVSACRDSVLCRIECDIEADDTEAADIEVFVAGARCDWFGVEIPSDVA